MLHKLDDVVRTAGHALELILKSEAHVNPWWTVVGAIVYLVSQGVRARGWHTILRAAYPEARELRPRNTVSAYLAGAGLNALIPARGGDVVKLAVVHRRIRGSRYTTLVATFVPETLFETLLGVSLVVWALAMGFLPVPTANGELPSLDASLIVEHPFISAAVAGGIGLGLTLLVRWLRRRSADVIARFRRGLAILGTPSRFFTGVASWQVLARLLKLGSLAAFMEAFHLPVTPSTVVLVMAAQGAGRIIPLAPASAGLRLAMLSYGFVEVTGHVVDIAQITAFTFGVGAVLCVAGILVSGAILGREFGTLSPRRALATARASFAARATTTT